MLKKIQPKFIFICIGLICISSLVYFLVNKYTSDTVNYELAILQEEYEYEQINIELVENELDIIKLEETLKSNLKWRKQFAVQDNYFIYILDGSYYPFVYIDKDDMGFNLFINKEIIKTVNKEGEKVKNELIKGLKIYLDCLDEVIGDSCSVIEYLYSTLIVTGKSSEYDVYYKDYLSIVLPVTLPVIFESTKAKPIIYLYSDNVIDVHVEIDFKYDVLTTSYPKYKNGWDVKVLPNSVLIDEQGREYTYLFWESKGYEKYNLSEGFVISSDEYIEFFQTKLSEIGMVDNEINEFITYWLPKCDEYPYVQISFQLKNYEESVKLNITPEPKNILRVFAVFKGLNEPIYIPEQNLKYYDSFKRQGFTVVEWGGTFLN